MELLTFLIAVLLGAAFQVHVLFGARKRARQIAGNLLLQWSGTSSGGERILSFLIVLGFVLYFSGMAYRFGSPHELLDLIVAMQIAALPWLFQCRTELRERGMLRIRGQKITLEPWSSVIYCRWLKSPGELGIRTQTDLRADKIPKKLRPEIEAVLSRLVEFRDADNKVLNRPARAPGAAERDVRELKIPRFQFDLRTLLLFMLVASAALSWYGIGYRRQQQEKAVLAHFAPFQPKIQWIGGSLWLDFSNSPTKPRDEDLVWLAQLPDLVSLDLDGVRITDAALIHLRNTARLKYLYALDAQISDAGIAHLEHLGKLKMLSLGSKTRITPAGKQKLQKALPDCHVY